jgi:hypothetical protein
MKKTVLTFGLISGAILSLLMIVTLPFKEQIGFDNMMVVGYTTMLAAFLLIFFGVRSYRDNVAGGSVKFGRAFAVGALIALISSAMYVATWEVIYFGTNSDFVEKYNEYQMTSARAKGATPAELEAKAAELKKWAEMYRNPIINAAMTFVEPLPLGLLVALVSAGVLSRRRRTSGLAAATS